MERCLACSVFLEDDESKEHFNDTGHNCFIGVDGLMYKFYTFGVSKSEYAQALKEGRAL